MRLVRSAIRLGFSCLLLLPGLAHGHIMSMSSGQLEVEGSRVYYELRMPLYEIVHLEEPERSLLENFRLFDDGREIVARRGSCQADSDEGVYRCEATFEFPQAVEQLEVECTFAAVTVPNHVHVLKAIRGDVVEQAVFDFSFSRSQIRFTPPTTGELFFSQAAEGLVRVIAGPFQILFLVALVLAGRSRRELFSLAAAFIVAESIAAVILVYEPWQPPARFIEAAAALTVAYLAIEILILPEAGYRWLVASGMGVFHGFYFGSFLQQSEMDLLYVLTGVVIAEAVLLLIFSYLSASLITAVPKLRPVKTGAALLFLVGIFWFVLRLRS
jgi:hydrogenase/urease accessory protein HupE